ncbi:MAG: SDR family oxidoreductase [Anaerolineae bacterium]|nr:SDR family oxidoreductase [Anaerolineae bacterium]
MKLVVFGASGRTGIPLVQQALDAGHQVVAFVRTPSKLPIQHERLSVVVGDVMNASDVARAITPGVDAVASVLSPVKGSPKNLLPVAVDNILQAMNNAGVRRLIYMTGAGVDMPGDQPKLINHVIKFALKTMAGDVLESSIAAIEKVRNSNLDWTIVRAPMLTNGPRTGQHRVGMVGVNTGPRLSRADAADFILKQLSDSAHLRKAPMISN